MLGKIIAGLRYTFNEPSAIIVLLLRFGFFAIFLLIACHPDGSFFSSDTLACFNMLLFAVANGYCTTAFMILGPERTIENK